MSVSPVYKADYPSGIESSEPDDNISPIDLIPDELLLKIFKKFDLKDLKNLRLVDHRFRSITEDRYVWSSIAISLGVTVDAFRDLLYEIKKAEDVIAIWKVIARKNYEIKYLNKVVPTISNLDFEKLKREEKISMIQEFDKWIDTNIDDIVITELDLSKLNLVYIPNSIGKLKRLKILNLSSNQIATLPQALGNLSSLETLNLNANEIGIFPNELLNLLSLRRLYFGSNGLKEVPSEIRKLDKLESLILANNQLSRLPKEIGTICGLKKLYLQNNNLTELPLTIKDLVNLMLFDISNNQITLLPSELQIFLSKVRIFSYSDNPIDLNKKRKRCSSDK